ncbi:MAG: hypothetical protein AAF681_03485 [Pseudomonadota bacterium]
MVTRAPEPSCLSIFGKMKRGGLHPFLTKRGLTSSALQAGEPMDAQGEALFLRLMSFGLGAEQGGSIRIHLA